MTKYIYVYLYNLSIYLGNKNKIHYYVTMLPPLSHRLSKYNLSGSYGDKDNPDLQRLKHTVKQQLHTGLEAAVICVSLRPVEAASSAGWPAHVHEVASVALIRSSRCRLWATETRRKQACLNVRATVIQNLEHQQASSRVALDTHNRRATRGGWEEPGREGGRHVTDCFSSYSPTVAVLTKRVTQNERLACTWPPLHDMISHKVKLT